MKATEYIRNLDAIRKSGKPIIVAGVGSGLTARGAASGGADVLAVYNTAVYRIQGLPTALAFLPYDNANTITLQVAPEVLMNAGNIPVLIGLGAHDPRTSIAQLVERVESLGAAGLTNEPFIGIYSKDIQAQLEAAGLGFAREVELIKLAVAKNMLALGWVFTPEEARTMAEAGAQIIGAMVGMTAGGSAGGVAQLSLDEALERIESIAEAALEVNPDVFVLGHGGPLNDPQSVAILLSRTQTCGYVTGSTGERVPVVDAVSNAIRSFKDLPIKI